MLVEKNFKQLMNQLDSGHTVGVTFGDLNILVRFLNDHSKIAMSTPVFNGGNYIPQSVRGCLSHKSPTPHPAIRSYLTVDETNFQVKLNYLGHADYLNQEELSLLVEEFGVIAEQWREYLEQHGKNDLVHINLKR